MTTAIWWIRRDLRLVDNAALTAAIHDHEAVIPLFILDQRLLESSYSCQRRTAFLLDGLRALRDDIRLCGGELIVRSGKPEQALQEVCRETGAVRIYAERDYSPFAVKRDARVADQVPLVLTEGVAALPVGSILKDDGNPYTVFTPFSRTWKSRWAASPVASLPEPTRIHTPSELRSDLIPAIALDGVAQLPVAGEGQATRVLQEFTENGGTIYRYGSERDQPAKASTSALSVYLRFGMSSAAATVRAAYGAIERAGSQEERSSAETWLNELIWREFYINNLHHFPHVRSGSFRSMYDEIVWANSQTDFEAWCAGKTGYPFVDAGMRQLATTGWMHNRLRMVTASFLVKDLLIDWRWGERWFMNSLIDGDPAANNGGWQWVAGTGTDAAPYFRLFNPVSQGQKFDSQGNYVRRWAPELRNVPDEFIHTPWEMSSSEQKRYGCVIGQDYAERIVLHSWARDRTIAAYKAVR